MSVPTMCILIIVKRNEKKLKRKYSNSSASNTILQLNPQFLTRLSWGNPDANLGA